MVAAADSAAAVVNQALDALQPVIAALYADVGVGHQHFLGLVTAVAATMRSPFHAELSISAVHVMQSVAQRLSQSDPEVSSKLVNNIKIFTRFVLFFVTLYTQSGAGLFLIKHL